MIKMTTIDMDWTDTGGRVLSSVPIKCPCCGDSVRPNVEHLCGDRLPSPPKQRRKARAK